MIARELPPPRMSLEEFRAWDSGDPFKYELYDGIPVLKHREPQALGYATREHNGLVARFADAVRAVVKPPCLALPELLVPNVEATSYFLPDFVVTCDPRDVAGSGTDLVSYPTLLVDVLSTGSFKDDVNGKRVAYLRLGAHVLTIDSRWRELRYWSSLDGAERHAERGTFEIPCLGFSLDIDALYDGILP